MLKRGIWKRLGIMVLCTASFPACPGFLQGWVVLLSKAPFLPGQELFTHGIAQVCEPGGKAASSS